MPDELQEECDHVGAAGDFGWCGRIVLKIDRRNDRAGEKIKNDECCSVNEG